MGWHRRNHGSRKYFCLNYREDGKRKKTYIGTGEVAELEARRVALRQFETELARQVWNKEKGVILEALDEFLELDDACNLLRDSVLLSNGYWRSDRHPWKESEHAKRILAGNGIIGTQGDGCRGETA